MQFQMRQERQLCRHLRERLFSLLRGGMAFLIILRKIAQNRPRVQDFCGKADRFGVKFVDDRLDSLIWLYYHLVG